MRDVFVYFGMNSEEFRGLNSKVGEIVIRGSKKKFIFFRVI